ncbi:MAG: Por secretion system protein, partial [Paludibacteraceae bacterium]|nr:Por secretion system protein [Paludibacteraceae bacterium]
SETIYAFPNPVRPEYGGNITIAGLEQDSKVWITDASANVVFEGKSNGGSLSWNGRNKSGQMVSGGVYFVLVSNGRSDAHRSVATKILIVR